MELYVYEKLGTYTISELKLIRLLSRVHISTNLPCVYYAPQSIPEWYCVKKNRYNISTKLKSNMYLVTILITHFDNDNMQLYYIIKLDYRTLLAGFWFKRLRGLSSNLKFLVKSLREVSIFKGWYTLKYCMVKTVST